MVSPRRGEAVRLWTVVAGFLVTLCGCAPTLSPLQQRAWDAFKDCKQQAPTAVLEQISEDGRLSYSAREGDVGIMQRCLHERYGCRFR